jgi:7,8-dihydroneopterin aldolase/epimerase/oxygenase
MTEDPCGAVCRVAIVGLTVPVRVGVHDHEHVAPQPIVIDARLGYALAPMSGDPYIDYDEYCTRLTTFLAQKAHTRLLETLAADIALWSFDTLQMLDTFEVSLHKPKIRDNAERLCVEFEWTRAAYRHASVTGSLPTRSGTSLHAPEQVAT